MKSSNKRSIAFILLMLLCGCIAGTIFSQIALFLPDGVVKDFFIQSISIGWGEADTWIDLNVIKFKTGLYINISALSLIGMSVSWYFLRFFR